MHFKLSTPISNLIKATSFWRDNRVVFRELKHFPGIAVLAVVFALLAAAFEGFSLSFLLAFLQSLVTPNARPLQTGVHWFDVSILAINASKTDRLYRISAVILVAAWLRAVFNYLTQVYTEIVQSKLIDRIRKLIFEQIQALSLKYLATARSGELINSMTNEIAVMKQAFNLTAFNTTKGMALVVYVLILFGISWPLTVISILLFTLLAVGLTTLNKKVREASFDVSKANGRFTSTAIEFVNGIRTVHAFATQDFERRRFYQASSDVERANVKAMASMALIRPIAEAAATTILVSMIVVAIAVFVANGTLQLASLLVFLFTLFRLVPAIHEINGNVARLSSFSGSVNNITEVLRTDDKIYLQNGTKTFTKLQRAIELVCVDFGYDAGNLVLHDVTLTIKQGQMTALVGSSGAGKSTLVDLITRFYDAVDGIILVDGVPIQEFDINSLRRKVAVVSQDTFIFNTSVRNNIAYGTEGADESEIWQAARLSNALEFIHEMPEGFDTQLGDRGVRLSGGQRQRIAIARALLRDPDILILDEATSALDSVSERLIQESLEKLSVGRTVIAIAHRLSTIVRADKVIVLEQGRVVEQGGYQELLEQRGKLWKYHQMQYQLADAAQSEIKHN